MLWGCAKRLFETYNGIITIKTSDDKSPDRISHISDLEHLFPNEDFYTRQ